MLRVMRVSGWFGNCDLEQCLRSDAEESSSGSIAERRAQGHQLMGEDVSATRDSV